MSGAEPSYNASPEISPDDGCFESVKLLPRFDVPLSPVVLIVPLRTIYLRVR